MAEPGFEPGTLRFGGRCSTTELSQQMNCLTMDAEKLVTIGALVLQQNQNIIRLQQDRVVWVRQWILRAKARMRRTPLYKRSRRR